jgi:hypothetical protein
MTPPAASIAILKANLEADRQDIEKLYTRLSPYTEFFTRFPTSLSQGVNTALEAQEKTIAVSYYLNNLYSAFENISLNVARTFENHIDDRSQWHSTLLKRMTLDIEGIRPKLWSEPAYQALNELRRFRHVFRNAYTIELDPQRIAIVLHQAQRLHPLYRSDLDDFTTFLDSLGSIP